MKRRWKVLWKTPEGQSKFKVFEGKKPSDAVLYAKSLKKQGLKPAVVSANYPYPPTPQQENNRRPGMIWCPYCLRWRNFKLFAIKRATYVTDAQMRCPICKISTNDYYVKKHNGFLEHMTEMDVIKKLTGYEGQRG